MTIILKHKVNGLKSNRVWTNPQYYDLLSPCFAHAATINEMYLMICRKGKSDVVPQMTARGHLELQPWATYTLYDFVLENVIYFSTDLRTSHGPQQFCWLSPQSNRLEDRTWVALQQAGPELTSEHLCGTGSAESPSVHAAAEVRSEVNLPAWCLLRS